MKQRKIVTKPTSLKKAGATFEVCFRESGGDCGPSVKVFGRNNQGEVEQLLRFDMFVKDPHYHYNPDTNDHKYPIDPNINYPFDFVLLVIEGRVHGDIALMFEKAGAEKLSNAWFDLDSFDRQDFAERVHRAMLTRGLDLLENLLKAEE